MFTIEGKYANALVTTDNIEEEAIAQITELVNHPASMGKLQEVIDNYVPSGMNVHQNPNEKVERIVSGLITPIGKSKDRIIRSLGTLGGGNHFIAIEGDGENNYLIIHTGSRNLGIQVAKYHQDKASVEVVGNKIQEMIDEMRAKGETSKIQQAIAEFKKNHQDELSPNKDLAYLEGQAMLDYLHDVKLTQRFAYENRMEIARTIFKHMGWTIDEVIESVHNYIDTDSMILRKGAISCLGTFLVPLNMRDGTLICYGESNPEWNDSAPHGAGRSMSRSRAKKELSMDEFKQTMEGIWSASVNESTLDEAPDAYKPAEEIKEIINTKYQVLHHLKPLFSFKAQE